MRHGLGLLLFCGLLPGWASAQMATDTCCRVGRARAASPGPGLVPAVRPTCYAPVLASPQLLYDPSKATLPVFRWKSGAPIYATDEQFIFRLVALPANKVLLENTTAAHQVEWPVGLRLPAATTTVRYSIQATRRDAAGEQCLSEATQGLLQVVSAPAPAAASYK